MAARFCEVEVGPETGLVEIARYSVVDDVGRCINPLIVHGQTHGGVAQGVGEAMWEECVVDPASGQPLSGSFMDYGMPRYASARIDPSRPGTGVRNPLPPAERVLCEPDFLASSDRAIG